MFGRISTLALALTTMTAAALIAQQPPAVTAIKAARLFDGNSDATITRRGRDRRGRPHHGRRLPPPVPAGARVIDLGDATLLPGFIDAHAHVTGESSDDWNADAVAGLRRTVPEQTLRAAEFARRTLMAGFTTVRDVGSGDYIDVGLRNAIADGHRRSARGCSSPVHALGARGGHCDNNGFPYVRFGPEPGIADGIASGADQFRDAVRFQVKYGADVIKVCATGGVLSLGDEVGAPQLTQAEMDALVDEAHRLGQQDRRARARRRGGQGRDPRRHRLHRARLVPRRRGRAADEGARHYLVPTLMAGEYAGGRKATRNYPPEIAAKARRRRRRPLAQRSSGRCGAGVKIAFGTDSGVSPHGRNAEEFALLVEHGMSPAAALRTSVAAGGAARRRQAGGHDRGRQGGRRRRPCPATPARTSRATEHVRFVMKGGKVVRDDRAVPGASSAAR